MTDKTQACARAPHFFLGSDGAIYDTRADDWSAKPIRQNFELHARHIDSIIGVKAALRAGAYAWPGGYEIAFYTQDGGVLCHACAMREFAQIAWDYQFNASTGWRVIACGIQEESGIFCDHCAREFVESESEDSNEIAFPG